MFYCRIHQVQHSCQSKHKKRRRHFSEDTCEHASLHVNSVAELAAHDVDTSTSLVAGHDSQENVNSKKKKKCKSHCHSDDHNIEDGTNSIKSLKHSERKRTGHCKKATNKSLLSLSQNLETYPAAQNDRDDGTAFHCVLTSDSVDIQTTGMLPEADNLEHLMQAHDMQPQTAVHGIESVEHSSLNVTLTPADNQVNESNLMSNEQQQKLSHSAKRRRRRHRTSKIAERKDNGDQPDDERSKNISAPVDSLLQNVSSSNKLPTLDSHSFVSGLGRRHIYFDNARSDDESSEKAVTATEPTSQLACDKYDSITSKDCAVSGNSTVVADSIVKNSSDIEAYLHFQNENTTSNGVVSYGVKKVSNTAHLPSKTKVYPKSRNAAFANVQVFCRQRIRKPGSASCMSPDQASNTTTTPLPEQASIGISFRLFIYCQSAVLCVICLLLLCENDSNHIIKQSNAVLAH